MRTKLLVLMIVAICLSACSQTTETAVPSETPAQETPAIESPATKSQEDMIFEYLTLAITESNKMTDIRIHTEKNAGSLENRIKLMTEEKAEMLRSKEAMEQASVPPGCEQAQSAQMKLYEIYDKFLSESLDRMEEEQKSGKFDKARFEASLKTLAQLSQQSAVVVGEHDKLSTEYNLK